MGFSAIMHYDVIDRLQAMICVSTSHSQTDILCLGALCFKFELCQWPPTTSPDIQVTTLIMSMKNYHELLEVPVEFLKAVADKVVLDRTDEADQDKLEVVDTLKSRLFSNLYVAFYPEAVAYFIRMWLSTIDASEGFEQHLQSRLDSTNKLFDEDTDIYALVDLASTQLENIKRYNSRTLTKLKAENLNEVKLQEMSNHYSNLYRGIRSLNMKIDILRYHVRHPQRRLKALVDRFSASVEGQLRQYEVELETTKSKVFELLKEKTKLFGLQWLPESWKGAILRSGMKLYILGATALHDMEKDKTV